MASGGSGEGNGRVKASAGVGAGDQRMERQKRADQAAAKGEQEGPPGSNTSVRPALPRTDRAPLQEATR
jgi:hypothetical protein